MDDIIVQRMLLVKQSSIQNQKKDQLNGGIKYQVIDDEKMKWWLWEWLWDEMIWWLWDDGNGLWCDWYDIKERNPISSFLFFRNFEKSLVWKII